MRHSHAASSLICICLLNCSPNRAALSRSCSLTSAAVRYGFQSEVLDKQNEAMLDMIGQVSLTEAGGGLGFAAAGVPMAVGGSHGGG